MKYIYTIRAPVPVLDSGVFIKQGLRGDDHEPAAMLQKVVGLSSAYVACIVL
jgi:hypothetical protein